jgi:hypothetical protein
MIQLGKATQTENSLRIKQKLNGQESSQTILAGVLNHPNQDTPQ